jgi:tRNA pseudouridine38-40 synthase
MGTPTLFGESAGTAPPTPLVPGPTVRLRLTLAYLGTGFRGFAAQPHQRTVAGVLTAALERYLRHTVELTCAGRTDAGVHAWGQVVSFDARAGVDPDGLRRAVNRAVGPAVSVRSAEVAGDGFDARRCAIGRLYRYTIVNREVPDPFLAATAWQVPSPLDLRAMRLACDPLYGEHDFASFCRRPRVGAAQAVPSLVRLVRHADWSPVGEGVLNFEMEASSFCHQMVRSVVGTMVEIGRGRRRAGDMAAVVRARDRAVAGPPAPPHGLCLWEVTY